MTENLRDQRRSSATWAAGITKPAGEPGDKLEGAWYALTLEDSEVIAPAAVADTGDGDNNHLLCLNDKRKVVFVSFPQGLVTDSNEDLNPATSLRVG